MNRRTLASQPVWVALPIGLCALLALSGCGLDKVEIPGLSGPSTTGIGLLVKASPDVLLADAVSTAVVRATVRGPDGGPVAGRTVFFAVTDENGDYVDLGTLYSSVATFHPPAPQTTEVTDGNGVAQVIYRVPERISVTAIQFVHIQARIVGDDANAFLPHTVLIELRPAEVRRFPANPDNNPPTCSIFVYPEVPQGGSYPVGFVVGFRTVSSDEDGQIVRYFWDFGDDTPPVDTPDARHAWRSSGIFTVTHVVTDNNGAIFSCNATIPVG